MSTIAKRIKQFNTGRNLEVLKLKYKNMRANAFAFYRGSCHLFYQDLPTDSFLQQSPASWVCGDLHLENFGCYKADNRAIYFDINDFDEGALAPCLFDISHLLTSLILAAEQLKTDVKMTEQLCESFLQVYAQTLQEGTARLMERKLAKGVLKEFLDTIKNRKRADFINKRTIKSKQQKLLIDEKKVLEVSSAKKQKITDRIESWAKSQPNPDFYHVLDVGYRIAGTGSLGVERYVLLVQGNGKKEHYLLDMKIANPSCLNPYLKLPQPVWKNEAERIIQIQSRMQIFPQALLHALEFEDKWFVFKELQPSQDKMDLTACKGNIKELSTIISSFAAIVAWDQLRSCGRQGSASTDELISFADLFSEWKKPLIDYSKNYAAKVEKDYKEFCAAYDASYFND
jgi:uncharacterized protein (DUF2252 family)